MPEVPDDDTLEMWLLGDAVRLATLGRDRRPEGGHLVDHATGLPLERGALLPDSHAKRGDQLALDWPVSPRQWARVHMGLWDRTDETTWDTEERAGVDETELKIKRVMRRLYLHRPMLFDEHPDLGHGELGSDRDGMCLVGRFTPEGLDYARAKVRGTSLEHGPVSCVADMPAHKRSSLPSWVLDEWRAEARA